MSVTDEQLNQPPTDHENVVVQVSSEEGTPLLKNEESTTVKEGQSMTATTAVIDEVNTT